MEDTTSHVSSLGTITPVAIKHTGIQIFQQSGRSHQEFSGAGARLMPKDMVLNRKQDIVSLFSSDHFGGYWLGETINEINVDTTAAHPPAVQQKTIYAISTFSKRDN